MIPQKTSLDYNDRDYIVNNVNTEGVDDITTTFINPENLCGL